MKRKAIQTIMIIGILTFAGVITCSKEKKKNPVAPDAFENETENTNTQDNYGQVAINPVQPEPNSTTVNNKPTIEASFYDFGTDSMKMASVKLTIANLSISDTIPKDYTQDADINSSRIIYTPTSAFEDGQIKVTVSLENKLDDASSLNWVFYIDSTAPVITTPDFNGTTYYNNYNSDIGIDYILNDNITRILRNVNIELYNGTTHMRTLEHNDYLSYGGQYIIWDRKDNSDQYVLDGVYTIKFQASDAAGNTGYHQIYISLISNL